jgi:CheY-like chemotaxis protein
VSLRILFADDSVTAQNMGRKILTEAGYDVVAVSNGAAAVKKIAEQKPDIIILDLYMPGYSGLEVCEKVRASIATVKTPVLLTVGKMEPYKPEDANRVRADGVIIKPFEASDLLAIVKKFEERIAQIVAAAPPPPPPPTESIEVAPPEPHFEHPEPPSAPTQPMVEVPDHMATASAFSDLLGSDTHAVDHYNVATAQRVPDLKPASGAAVAAVPLPDYDIPASWREPEPIPAAAPEPVAEVAAPEVAEVEEPAPVATAAPVPAPPELPEPLATAAPQETPPARPRLIPIFQEQAGQAHDFIPTAAAPIGDIDIPREPHLQETAEETTRNTVADAREPGLMPTLHQPAEQLEEDSVVAEFTPEPEPPAPAVVQAAPEIATPPPLRLVTEPAKAEMDFESRVAAAMAAYSAPPEPPPVANVPSPATHAAAAAAPAPAPLQAEPVEVPQSPEHQFSAGLGAENREAATVHPVAEPAAAEHSTPADQNLQHEEIAAKIEKELPAAAAAAASEAGAEHHQTIAQAVHRVMDRVKGDLVEEIMRELKSKK